jgi:hypothetical protein
VLTTAPPRLFCLLGGTGRKLYIKVVVESGSLREVREFVWSEGFEPQHMGTPNSKPGLEVIKDLCDRDHRLGALFHRAVVSNMW